MNLRQDDSGGPRFSVRHLLALAIAALKARRDVDRYVFVLELIGEAKRELEALEAA